MAHHNRRSFVARTLGLVTVGGAVRSVGIAQAQARPRPAWDMSWVDRLSGRHRQVYDLLWHTLRPNTLTPPTNYFETHEEMSGLKFPDVNVVVGANSTSFPINASDALWAKFKIGERFTIDDPETGQRAVRNVYLGSQTDPRGGTVRGLQARGAVFMMCNNSLMALANEWARDLKVSTTDLHAELTAGLNPGVHVVPALTWAIGLLQERGFTYERL